GLAFQLIDDVLDFTGTSSSLGKGSLSDIRHIGGLVDARAPSGLDNLHGRTQCGIVTAPILFAIEEFPDLRAVVDRGFENPGDVDLVSFLISFDKDTYCAQVALLSNLPIIA
ncbi:hypothetical protein RJ639_013134, partial [Escallonia herrerae]